VSPKPPGNAGTVLVLELDRRQRVFEESPVRGFPDREAGLSPYPSSDDGRREVTLVPIQRVHDPVTIDAMNDEQREPTRPDWVNEAEEALERAADAIRDAWDQTRDSRMNALGSARQAAKQLGEAIDRGVEAAKSSWQGSEGTEPSAGDEATPNQQSGAGEEE
jgi:hypothetical protein